VIPASGDLFYRFDVIKVNLLNISLHVLEMDTNQFVREKALMNFTLVGFRGETFLLRRSSRNVTKGSLSILFRRPVNICIHKLP
jgi:hypothetical protein